MTTGEATEKLARIWATEVGVNAVLRGEHPVQIAADAFMIRKHTVKA